jgi:hypothetical protein
MTRGNQREIDRKRAENRNDKNTAKSRIKNKEDDAKIMQEKNRLFLEKKAADEEAKRLANMK